MPFSKNNYQWNVISLTETNYLRALAILLIITHNFLHWVMNTPGENEFTFSPEKFQSFKDSLWNHPQDCVRILSTYLGHYGVQIFFFLSGYGIAIKYRSQNPTWFKFVAKRLTSLYPAIIIAAIGYIVYEGIRLGFSNVIHAEGINLIRQVTGISNFIPDNIYHPIGPWWFIGVIIQFYLIAPLILKQHKIPQSTFLYIIIAASLLSEWLLTPILKSHFSLNINHTILGHLDTCALGMLLAQYEKITTSRIKFLSTLAASLIIFILGNYYSSIWVLSSLSITIILIPSFRLCVQYIKKAPLFNRFIILTGNLSMYLFLCNGYLRRPLIEYAKNQPVWWKSITLCLIFLILAYAWSILLKHLTLRFQQLLTRINT